LSAAIWSIFEKVEDQNIRQDSNRIILRPVNEKTFFSILPHSFRISFQSFQKVLIGPQKNILENYQKVYKKRRILS